MRTARAGAIRRRRPGLAEVAELRLLLGWRRLRAPGGAAEGIAQLLLFLVALPASVLFAALVGVGSFRAARSAPGLQATLTLAAVLYGLWQTWTAIGLATNERDGMDLRRLLVYPVPPARLYLLGLGASLVGDPFAIFWLVVLAGMLGGAALARPGAWLLLLALVLAAFAAATVACIALAQEVLARLGRSRRWRELAAVAAVAGWLAIAFSTSAGAGALRGALPVLRQLRWILFPAALAVEAAIRLYAGRPLASLAWLGMLAGAAVVTARLAYRMAISTALSGGEAGRVAVPPGASRRRSLFPEWTGPLFEKELRSLSRHPAARIYVLAMPALSAFVAWKAPAYLSGDASGLARALPLFGLAAYVHLGFQVFWVNGLGFERGGARALFLAPVAPERVLAAKNLALFACTSGVFALSAGTYLAVAGAQPPWIVAGALALEVGLAPLLYGLGNVLGIVTPRAASLGLQRAGSVSPLAALAAMGITSAALAVFAVPVLAALWLDALWALPFAWAAVAGGAAAAWWATLPLAGRLLAQRRERVLAIVCGDAGAGG